MNNVRFKGPVAVMFLDYKVLMQPAFLVLTGNIVQGAGIFFFMPQER